MAPGICAQTETFDTMTFGALSLTGEVCYRKQ
jgi:hypothetical protein